MIAGLRHDHRHVPRQPVDASLRDDHADGADVHFGLQFGERAGPAPAEAGAEGVQPLEQRVGALLGDRAAELRLDGLAARETLDGVLRPPHARQIHARQIAVVVRVDVAERRAVARLIARVRRLLDVEIVDDRVERAAQFLRRRAHASGHAGLRSASARPRPPCASSRGPAGAARGPRRCRWSARPSRERRTGTSARADSRPSSATGTRNFARGEAAEERAVQARLDLVEAVLLDGRHEPHAVAVRQLRDHVRRRSVVVDLRLAAQPQRRVPDVNLEDRAGRRRPASDAPAARCRAPAPAAAPASRRPARSAPGAGSRRSARRRTCRRRSCAPA